MSSRKRLVVIAIAIIGIAASALAAVWVGSTQGLYVGKVEVVIHAPRSETTGNPLASRNDQAVRFAGLIAEVASNGQHVPRVTNQDLTLADQGMRHETLISLVNLGGQWANDFSRPFIRVEAVDHSAEAVDARLREGIDQVQRAMERLEDEADVAPSARGSAEVVPAAPQVRFEPTHRVRAVAMTLLLGLGLTTAVCRLVARKLSSDAGRTTPQKPDAAPPHRNVVTGH